MTTKNWIRIGFAWFLLLLGTALNAWASATMCSIVLKDGEGPPFGYVFRLYWVPALTGGCALAILLLGIAGFRRGPKHARYVVAIPMLVACWWIVDLLRWGLQRIL